jgi:hypothetical protein
LLYIGLRLLGITRQAIAFSRKAKLPKPEFNHPILGKMTFEEGIWTSHITHQGRPLTCTVSGDANRPSPDLLAAIAKVLADLDAHAQAAVEFLLPTSTAVVSRTQFTLEAIDCLWENRPTDFTLEFALDSDPDGIWRVEFQDGRPLTSNRDD